MGVSGFLTSWATCRAISAQAARRLLRSRSRRCRSRSPAIWLKESTRPLSSSRLVVATRASRSPPAIARVASVRSRMGPEMRRDRERARPAARARKAREARRIERSRSSRVAWASRSFTARGRARMPGSSAAQPHGHVGHEGREAADALRAQHRRRPLEGEGAEHRAGDRGGKQPRREQLALARGEEAALAEDVEVARMSPATQTRAVSVTAARSGASLRW